MTTSLLLRRSPRLASLALTALLFGVGCNDDHATLCEGLAACDHVRDVDDCVAEMDENDAEYDCSGIVEAGLDDVDAAQAGDCGGLDNWVSVYEDYGPYCLP